MPDAEAEADAGGRRGRPWRPWLPPPVVLAVALVAAAASLTPSLLPKPAPLHGLVIGLAAGAGYALGALLRWLSAPLWRRLPDRLVALGSGGLLVIAVISLLIVGWLAIGWQRDLAAAVGQAVASSVAPLAALLVAAVVLVGLVATARVLRLAVRQITRALARFLPWWLAVLLAAVLVPTATYALLHHVVRGHLLIAVDESFKLVDQEAGAGLSAPTVPWRSGGPGSAVPWSTIGSQGREFLSLPGPADPAVPPARVYAGIESAADPAARARLLVRELERTGGFDRAVVCLVVPTGTGWVDPAAVTALEATWAGDTAIASMQYSYLPSALSFLVDRSRVEEAAEAILTAVLARWRALPLGERPQLLLYGESLGARGAETALLAVPNAAELVDGVLLVGPPHSNPLWSELVEERDPGSPVLAPVVNDGRSVRFWPGPEMPGVDRVDDPWPAPPGPRILYLQHPSDPVVWWSPSLLWSRPEWLTEREELTNQPSMPWWPVVTFWQVTGDLPAGTSVPPGHGHNYRVELAPAWAVLTSPPPQSTDQ